MQRITNLEHTLNTVSSYVPVFVEKDSPDNNIMGMFQYLPFINETVPHYKAKSITVYTRRNNNIRSSFEIWATLLHEWAHYYCAIIYQNDELCSNEEVIYCIEYGVASQFVCMFTSRWDKSLCNIMKLMPVHLSVEERKIVKEIIISMLKEVTTEIKYSNLEKLLISFKQFFGQVVKR